MVRDGYFYGIGSLLAAVLIAWLTAWPYAVPVILIGIFCLWFFRDPERPIPSDPGAIVSPETAKSPMFLSSPRTEIPAQPSAPASASF